MIPGRMNPSSAENENPYPDAIEKIRYSSWTPIET